jgi:adenosylhomocysteinase
MDVTELEWIAWTTPITTSLGAALAASDFSGRTEGCRQHILADTICIGTPFVEAGARVRLGCARVVSLGVRSV